MSLSQDSITIQNDRDYYKAQANLYASNNASLQTVAQNALQRSGKAQQQIESLKREITQLKNRNPEQYQGLETGLGAALVLTGQFMLSLGISHFIQRWTGHGYLFSLAAVAATTGGLGLLGKSNPKEMCWIAPTTLGCMAAASLITVPIAAAF